MRIRSAQFISSVHRRDDFPKDRRPEITFLGRSNVGKSSVINALLKRPSLARTSSTPGRTQAINFYLINEDFYFVDLPGYGYAKVPEALRRSWKALVEAYLTDRRRIVLGILIVDARHEPKPLDVQMRDWLTDASVPYIVVLTKADKLSRNELARSVGLAKSVFPQVEVIPFSAVTHLGAPEVWRAIELRLARLKNSLN
ncbi:MAG: YihA family ribosome biogenesis GTP-binding protein [Acidobacteria bacterium]|nr:YihA family ribosome biogenesis GTP-binding protein [Acidobacteriota bacterium]